MAVAFLIAVVATGMITVNWRTRNAGGGSYSSSARTTTEPILGGEVPQSFPDQNAVIANGLAEARRAHTDMLVHALRHGIDVVSERTFGPIDDFDVAWTLYSADIVTADGTVTLYTAVHKKEPFMRYTSSWDAHNGSATPWQPVTW
jgi:hypothetical protein